MEDYDIEYSWIKTEYPDEEYADCFCGNRFLIKEDVSHTNHCEECRKILTTEIQTSSSISHTLRSKFSQVCNVCDEIFINEQVLKQHSKMHLLDIYECDVCHKLISRKCNFERHTLKHARMKQYKCDNCNDGFNTKRALESHYLLHTNVKPVVCDGCKKSFPSSDAFISHNCLSNDRKIYRCGICVKTFICKQICKYHRFGHFSKNTYCCHKCPNSFALEDDLKDHIKCHNIITPLKCDICSRSFSDTKTLQLHIGFHKRMSSHTCHRCGRMFSTARGKKAHKRLSLDCTENKIFSCNVCHVSLLNCFEYWEHQWTSLERLSFQCEVCQNRFSDMYQFRTHSKTHAAKNLFECHVCIRTFSCRYLLQLHLYFHKETKSNFEKHKKSHALALSKISHQNAKKNSVVSCNKCSKRFLSKMQHRIHQLKHTRRKSFNCDMCPKIFDNQYELYKHIRIHTGTSYYKCDSCYLTFNSEKLLMKHKCLHTRKKCFSCHKCGRTFLTKSGLSCHHQHSRHSCNEPYSSINHSQNDSKEISESIARDNLNEFVYVMREQMNVNLHDKTERNEHSSQKPVRNNAPIDDPVGQIEEKALIFSCNDCSKAFPTKSEYEKHLLQHSTKQFFQCDLCPKAFYDKYELYRHVRVHTGAESYQCDTCCMSFKFERAFSKHRCLHTSKQMFSCEKCGKRFPSKSALAAHHRLLKESCSESHASIKDIGLQAEEHSNKNISNSNAVSDLTEVVPADQMNPEVEIEQPKKDGHSLKGVVVNKSSSDDQSIPEVIDTDLIKQECSESEDQLSQDLNITEKISPRSNVVNVAQSDKSTEIMEIDHSNPDVLNENGVEIDASGDATEKNIRTVFSCDRCGEIFPTDEEIMHHLKFSECEESTPTSKSNLTSESVDQNSGLPRNENADSVPNDPKTIASGESEEWICFICKEQFEDESQKRHHYVTVHPADILECDYCFKVLCAETEFEEHYQLHGGKVFFECDVCKLQFAKLSELRTHFLIHDVGTESPEDANYKESEKNFPTISYICKLCELSFLNEKQLILHYHSHSKNSKTCSICSKTFEYFSELHVHYRTHTVERPFGCVFPGCNEHFKSKTLLQLHRKIHAGLKPYECEICKKHYARRDHLRNHLKKHGIELSKTIANIHFSQCASSLESEENRTPAQTAEVPETVQVVDTTNLKQLSEVSSLEVVEDMQIPKSEVPESGLWDNVIEIVVSQPESTVQPTEKPAEPETVQVSAPRKRRRKQKKEEENKVPAHKRTKKEYFCTICDKMFPKKRGFIEHFCRHTGEKPHVCDICNKKFTLKRSLINHTRHHTGELPFECEECGKCFAQKEYLKQHSYHHIGKPIECTECNKTFSFNNEYEKHFRVHTGEKPYECSICNKHFSRRAFLKNHMFVHTGNKPFPCTICDKSFMSRGFLEKHYNTHIFKCKICNQNFPNAKDLKEHYSNHKDRQVFYCDHCDNVYVTKLALDIHYRKVNDECTFKCDICEKGFIDVRALKRHGAQHEEAGERPFVCEICREKFALKINLDVHIKKHTLKMHTCEFCGNKYKLRKYLMRHYQLHVKENGITCETCGNSFDTVPTYQKHKCTSSTKVNTKEVVVTVIEKAL